ncbi:MAG: hypothetical protein C4527_05125 [Candidatus Omnitrophota bacterium]|jgi:hypothetical protein|nr:MAG: hypothetical protein C4527_05125 [Candidatus Omnitrophota bacterium]
MNLPEYRFILFLLICIVGLSCASKPDSGEDAQVTTMGNFEVTAQLEEIKGDLIDDPLYDYAFVFKYKVLETHRGNLDTETIYVGHYNPLKPRETVADVRSGKIGGNLKKFRVGDVHRMAMDVPIDEQFMGGIVNRYFEENVSPIYWAVWTNRVIR